MYISTPDQDFFQEATFFEDQSFRKKMDSHFASCKAKGSKKSKGSGQYTNGDPLIKFLRNRISRLNYGVNVPDVGVRPELTTAKLIERYNGHKYGASLKNDQFADHFAANKTFYFWADHTASNPEILVLIDGDAGKKHGSGTTEGCWKFMELVKEKLFPGLYLEPSTHGEGVHGYFILEKEGIKVDLVRSALRNLDAYLKKLAESVGADIACVEIKGLPPRVSYDDKKNISHITFGLLAKLPRGRGVMDTCKVKYSDLAMLDPEEIVVPEPEEPEVETIKVGKLKAGSFDSRVVRQEVLDMLPELERYAENLLFQWTGATSIKADRWTVTATDLAQFFVLMQCIKPKPDDSLPVRAIGRLWEEVYLAGDFARPWNHHRFKAIRDLLSQHGHIDWVDHRFQNLPDGKGRCSRWRISYLLQRTLSSLMGGTTVVDTAGQLPDGPHEFLVPKWFNFVSDRPRRWWTAAEDEVERLLAA